ncbi:hypothetical protein V8E55_005375 [Tylopilus felleus]
MAAIAPYIDDTMVSAHQETKTPLHAIISTDDDLEDSSILDDIGEVAKLMTVLCNQVESSAEGNKVTIVLKYLNAYNVCCLLTDAINAVDLVDRIQTYMIANIEMLLESRILDDLDPRVFDKLKRAALEKHKEWLALQDIPVPTRNPGCTHQPRALFFVRRWRLPRRETRLMDDADGGPSLRLNPAQTTGSDDTLALATTVGSARLGWKKNPATLGKYGGGRAWKKIGAYENT